MNKGAISFKNLGGGSKQWLTKQAGTKISLLLMGFILYASCLLYAQDYPQQFMGAGSRDYLADKIQNGYFVEVFTKMDMRQKERIIKRNQVEEILNFSYEATPQSGNGILETVFQEKDNADNLKTEIAKRRQQREKNASAQTEFNYIKYSDGKVVYLKDGLATRAENERVVDEFGNVSIKNTFDMQYNDKRLLTSYEATVKDNLGNTSRLFWYGVSYTSDSVFYGGKDTQANKNISDYYLKEIDSAGNAKLTHWEAVSYEGKLLHAFSQTIEDSVYGNASFTRSNIRYEGNNLNRTTSYHEEGIGNDGLAYTLDRSKITYGNKDLLTGYHEEIYTTQIDGFKTKARVDAQFHYLDTPNPFGSDIEDSYSDKLLESIITINTSNPDGSRRVETTTTTYNYDKNSQLADASAKTKFDGQEAQWYEYRDAQGHVLSRNDDENGNVTYSYADLDNSQSIIVPENLVAATLKDGNKYTGSSETKHEVLNGKPMAKEINSRTLYYAYDTTYGELQRIEESTITYNNGLVNNLQRQLSNQENTKVTRHLLDTENSHAVTNEINTSYTYDEKGNLTATQGTGQGNGWEYSSERGWWGKYTSTITTKYDIILGKALRKLYSEDKDYE